MLQTRAMREAAAAKRASSFSRALLRLHFADGLVLEASFAPLEPLSAVRGLLSACVEPGCAGAVYAFTTPPKQRLGGRQGGALGGESVRGGAGARCAHPRGSGRAAQPGLAAGPAAAAVGAASHRGHPAAPAALQRRRRRRWGRERERRRERSGGGGGGRGGWPAGAPAGGGAAAGGAALKAGGWHQAQVAEALDVVRDETDSSQDGAERRRRRDGVPRSSDAPAKKRLASNCQTLREAQSSHLHLSICEAP